MRTMVLVLFGVLIAATLSCDRGPDEEARALELVKQAVECELRQDWECVEARMDLGAKAESLLGEIYTRAAPEEQARTREILMQRFILASRKTRSERFEGGAGALEIRPGGENGFLVQEKGAGDDFSYEYQVVKQGEAWIIRDRLKVKGGKAMNPAALVSSMVRSLEKDLGRAPTLADVNGQMNSYLDNHQVRMIKVPEKAGGKR